MQNWSKRIWLCTLKDKNFRFPHIGSVVLNNNVELGANCTIDRGSIGDTVIGKILF